MDDFHHWLKPADQFAISVPIIFEGMGLLLKQFEYSVGGITGSESACERILGQIYTNLLGVVVECIDDELEVGRGSGRHCLRCFRRRLRVPTRMKSEDRREKGAYGVLHAASLAKFIVQSHVSPLPPSSHCCLSLNPAAFSAIVQQLSIPG
jgi:hypothetical protein